MILILNEYSIYTSDEEMRDLYRDFGNMNEYSVSEWIIKGIIE